MKYMQQNKDITKKNATANAIEPYSPKEIEVIKAKFLAVKNPTVDYQRSHLVELRLILNDMDEWFEKYGEFQDPKLYGTLSRNLINLTDKMRRQDEGIKMNVDLRETHDEFRKIIDISAKNMEAEEAEFMEEHEKNKKRNNPSSRDKSKA